VNVPGLVAHLRQGEIDHRAQGRLETADSTRQVADALEKQGVEALSCCAPLRGSAERLDAEIGWRP
jgi:hypothetical protein